MIIQICPLFNFSTYEQWRALLGTIVIFSKQICFKIEKHEKCVFVVLVRLNVAQFSSLYFQILWFCLHFQNVGEDIWNICRRGHWKIMWQKEIFMMYLLKSAFFRLFNNYTFTLIFHIFVQVFSKATTTDLFNVFKGVYISIV